MSRIPGIATVLLLGLVTLLPACFAESGLRDEFREATRAVEDLADLIEDAGPIREAADRATDGLEEARTALEEFRENPTTGTRRALGLAERRLNDVRDSLERLIDRAPENVREALGEVVDALERVRREIRGTLESS